MEEPEILSVEKYLSDKWGIDIMHDGTGNAGRMPWQVTPEQDNLKEMQPVAKTQDLPNKIVAGAVILASLTQPVEVIELEKSRKLPENELKAGKVIKEGYQIKVGSGGQAVIVFTNGAVTTLAENTNLVIRKFLQSEFVLQSSKLSEQPEEPSVSQTMIDLSKGQMVVEVKKLRKGSNFEVTTRLGVAGIRGTRFLINLDEQEGDSLSTGIVVTEGKVYCKPLSKGKDTGWEFNLEAGEKFFNELFE